MSNDIINTGYTPPVKHATIAEALDNAKREISEQVIVYADRNYSEASGYMSMAVQNINSAIDNMRQARIAVDVQNVLEQDLLDDDDDYLDLLDMQEGLRHGA